MQLCAHTVETHTHKSPVTKTYSLTHTNKTIHTLPPLSVGTADKLLCLVSVCSERKLKQCGKMYRCEWRRQATEGRRMKRKASANRSQRNKKEISRSSIRCPQGLMIIVQLSPVSSHRELLTALLHKYSTQEDRESPPTVPSSKIINASCSGGSTWWPKVQWCSGDIAQKKRKWKRSVFCTAKRCETVGRRAQFSALFVSHAVTLNPQTELLDKTVIFSRVKLAWILFFIMHLSVRHDSQGAAGKQNKISSFDWL